MLLRTLLLGALWSAATLTGQAGRPRPLTTAQTEARNEAAVPGFAPQTREARRITLFLADALRLNLAQQQAVQACTAAERQALALALTAADCQQAQGSYRLAVHRVLAPSQGSAYEALRQQLNGTLLPVDGTELACR